jgi:F-type H+-transporting ATPase subunit a
MEHELWFTALLNKLLAPLITPLLVRIGHGAAPSDPVHPIPNYIAMEVLVMLVIIIGALILRARLSVEKPGAFQQIGEVIVEFTRNLCEELIGHGAMRYVALIGTLGIFLGLCNLLGLIPTLETPTAHIQVTLGCAIITFLYYNFHGMRHHGVLGYLKHLAGPMLAIAILMFPIELIGNFARMLSLSVRLFANMFAGDTLEEIFAHLVKGPVIGAIGHILLPPVFMALHIFVSALQAYIFMLLTAVYISLAVAEEH